MTETTQKNDERRDLLIERLKSDEYKIIEIYAHNQYTLDVRIEVDNEWDNSINSGNSRFKTIP